MMRILFIVCGSFLLLLSLTIVQPAKISSNKPTIDTTVFIAQHNYYRAKVGSPPIHWNDSLANYAQEWADKLAKTCDMQHSDGPYGENIYWSSAPKNEKAAVDRWASEEKYFNHNNPTYIRGKVRRADIILK